MTGLSHAEDAAVVRFPAGQALVQTLDFLTPLVDDPFLFGQIAAANSLSDVYAMGGVPYTAMNIACFPTKDMDAMVLKEILRGGQSKVEEAQAMLVGGHTVQDQELKYGLSVTGVVDPLHFATNTGLQPGDKLILTKPLGSGVLATAIKAQWEGASNFEKEIGRWCAHLNRIPGQAIQEFHLTAATDVTGFGLGGHVLEMARASKCDIRLWSETVPFMHGARELAAQGLIPAGSFANKGFCQHQVQVSEHLDPVVLDLLFDAQTSGGMILAVEDKMVHQVQTWLQDRGELAEIVGEVLPLQAHAPRLLL